MELAEKLHFNKILVLQKFRTVKRCTEIKSKYKRNRRMRNKARKEAMTMVA